MKKDPKKLEAVRRASEPKSRLLDVARQLDEARGASVAAEQLRAIIARLEDWQDRHN